MQSPETGQKRKSAYLRLTSASDPKQTEDFEFG